MLLAKWQMVVDRQTVGLYPGIALTTSLQSPAHSVGFNVADLLKLRVARANSSNR